MLVGVVIDDAQMFNARLQEWEHFYNFRAPPRGPCRPDALLAATTRDQGLGVSGLR